jgi:hypothetical protein
MFDQVVRAFEELRPYLFGLLATISFVVVGQVLKFRVWTKGRARRNALIAWGRASMFAHPFVAGLLLGLVPGIPDPPGASTVAARCLYYAGAGALASGGFWVLQLIAKRRYLLDIERELAGELTDVSVPPPPMPITIKPKE